MAYALKRDDYIRFGYIGGFGGVSPLIKLETLPEEKFLRVNELIQTLQSPDIEMDTSSSSGSLGRAVLVTDKGKPTSSDRMRNLFVLKAFKPVPKAFRELDALLYPEEEKAPVYTVNGITTPSKSADENCAEPTRTVRTDENLRRSSKIRGTGIAGDE